MMDVKLVWRSGFLISQKARMKSAQQYVDETCVKRMQPYVPIAPERFKKRGVVLRSVKIQTPGRIVYMTEYPKTAKFAYYSRGNHKNGGNPNARRLWFNVMKRQHLNEIKQGAAKIMGAKPK